MVEERLRRRISGVGDFPAFTRESNSDNHYHKNHDQERPAASHEPLTPTHIHTFTQGCYRRRVCYIPLYIALIPTNTKQIVYMMCYRLVYAFTRTCCRGRGCPWSCQGATPTRFMSAFSTSRDHRKRSTTYRVLVRVARERVAGPLARRLLAVGLERRRERVGGTLDRVTRLLGGRLLRVGGDALLHLIGMLALDFAGQQGSTTHLLAETLASFVRHVGCC